MSASVFPARAGMSPPNVSLEIEVSGVPRASGDEPELASVLGASLKCSPRERG